MEAVERRKLRCVWVTGGRALTEQEAANEIVSEARLLLREDLARLGVQWDPTTLPPGAPGVISPDDHHSSGSETSSGSNLRSHGAQGGNTKDGQEGGRLKKSKSRDTDGHGEEDNRSEKRKQEKPGGEIRREQGKSNPAEKEENKKFEVHRKEDGTDPEMRQTGNETPVESGKETEKKAETNKNMSMANKTKNLNEKLERQTPMRPEKEEEEPKKPGEKSEGPVSGRPVGQKAKQPVPERSLTQELAEIVSSPLPQSLPHPQPTPPPRPPPRFRPPISWVEEQLSVSTSTLKRHSTTGGAASPVQQSRQKHSRALSKVLNSIQTDRGAQDNVETVRTSPLKSADTSGPAVQQSTDDPVQQTPPSVSDPTNGATSDPPLFSPEAKRRRVEAGEVDKFSSPELYAGDEGDEGDVEKGQESFGDSFELDTQTERFLVQQSYQYRNEQGRNQMLETEKTKEEGMVETAVELEGDNAPAPNNPCPRFNISITDSQMELILNTSHQVTLRNQLL